MTNWTAYRSNQARRSREVVRGHPSQHPLVGRWPAVYLSAMLLAAFTACATRDGGFTIPKLDVPFEHYSLPNGLDVILREDHRVPVAAVNLWYRVGPANEDKGSTGFAHLFEHMMLQGSRHAPGDYFRRLQAVGATSVNGNTDLDRTSYMEDVPSNQLELALWLESDRMGFLLDALNEETLANQKAVARNERRQNIENAPYGLAQEEVYRLLFPRGHPYRSSVLGSHADIQSATLPEVRKFFKRFYGPNNASLAIVGDIDIPATRAMVKKYFGTIPRGAEVPNRKLGEAGLDREMRSTVTDRVELPRIYMAWHTSPAFEPGDAVANVTARMLGGGKASRLFENLVYLQQIAQTASARQRSLAHGSVFQIVATAKPGHSAGELEDAVWAELERLGRDGPGKKELAATKSAIVAITIKSLEPFRAVADRLNAYKHFIGDPGYLNDDLQRYAEVTAEDVRDFVREKLLTKKRAVVYVKPGAKVLPEQPPESPAGGPPNEEQPAAPAGMNIAAAANAAPAGRATTGPARKAAEHAAKPAASREGWRYTVPRPRVLTPVKVPVPETFDLDNGLKVFVARAGSLPLVHVRLIALQGTSSDPAGLPGLADYTAAMLNEGAGRRSAIQIADDLTALGSTLETGASKETSWVNVQALRPQLRKTMSILRDVVVSPAFPHDEVERLRSDRLTALRQERDEPMTTALKTMWRELYGPGHPYAHGDLGTEEAIHRTTRKNLQDAYRRIFTPGNSALILTGDITAEQGRKLASELFGSWQGAGIRPPPPSAGAPAPERVLIIDKPGAPQSAVVLAQTGIPRSDPDFGKLTVMNKTLGGLFSSRLNQSLRETHGYTYGVTSVVSRNRGPGPIRISASVEQQFTGASVREALRQVSVMHQGGITREEFDEAKQAILYSVTDLFDTNASTASTIGDLFTFGLPPDQFRGLPQRLAAMDPAAVSAAAKQHLRPHDMKVIVVGDKEKIDPQLKQLGLGAVGYRTPDGLAP